MKKLLLTLAILFSFHQANAAAALVQSAKAYPAAPLAFPSNNTAGNLIIVNVGNVNSGAGAQVTDPTITDTQGNTYIKIGSYWVANGATIKMYYAKNIAGGANTVTVTPAGAVPGIDESFEIAEISGLDTTNPLVTSSTGVFNNTSSWSAGSLTLGTAGFIYAGFSEHRIGGTVTAGSGFTMDQQSPGAADGTQYQVVSAGTYTPTFGGYSNTGGYNGVMIAAAFRTPVAASGPGSYIDALRLQTSAGIIHIAAIDPLATGGEDSPLRIAKNGVIYKIALVDITDANASKVRIQTSSGVKALRLCKDSSPTYSNNCAYTP